MERIRLSREEKRIYNRCKIRQYKKQNTHIIKHYKGIIKVKLRHLREGGVFASEMKRDKLFEWNCSCLEKKALVRFARIEGGSLEGLTLTLKGKTYLQANPKLKNPIDRNKVYTIVTIVLALVAVIALLKELC